MLKYVFLFLHLYLISLSISGQYSSNWILKVEPLNAGMFYFGFNGSFPPTQTFQPGNPKMLRGFSCITDGFSNFFYTNGQSVFSGDGNIVANGDSITIFSTPFQNLLGHACYQSNFFIPKPGFEDSLFIVFHFGRDTNIWYSNFNTAQSVNINLYYSVLYSKANNGKGQIILKSQALINDTLAAGRLSACKHANGRDWWILVRKNLEPTYYRYIITPDTIRFDGIQSFQGILPPLNYISVGNGNNLFTPDGFKFVQIESAYGGTIPSRVTIFDFDRCSGTLTNPFVVNIVNSGYYLQLSYVVRGVISPNSRFLYVSTGYFIYQYDLTSSNIAGSKQTVAFYDSTYCPLNNPSPLYFLDMKLADDNRIYISTGGCYADVIHYPDSPAVACSLVVHNLSISSVFSHLTYFPYHPDYSLGPLTGSPCDTLTGYHEQQIAQANITVSPNPGQGLFKIVAPAILLNDGPVSAEVFDLTGRKVLTQKINAEVSYLDLTSHSDGLFLIRFFSKGKLFSLKVVKQTFQ